MRVNFRLLEAPNTGRRRLVHARDVMYGEIDKGKDGWSAMLQKKQDWDGELMSRGIKPDRTW